MMGQAGRPTSHYLLYLLYLALSCLACFVCLLEFNVEEIFYNF